MLMSSVVASAVARSTAYSIEMRGFSNESTYASYAWHKRSPRAGNVKSRVAIRVRGNTPKTLQMPAKLAASICI